MQRTKCISEQISSFCWVLVVRQWNRMTFVDALTRQCQAKSCKEIFDSITQLNWKCVLFSWFVKTTRKARSCHKKMQRFREDQKFLQHPRDRWIVDNFVRFHNTRTHEICNYQFSSAHNESSFIHRDFQWKWKSQYRQRHSELRSARQFTWCCFSEANLQFPIAILHKWRYQRSRLVMQKMFRPNAVQWKLNHAVKRKTDQEPNPLPLLLCVFDRANNGLSGTLAP